LNNQPLLTGVGGAILGKGIVIFFIFKSLAYPGGARSHSSGPERMV